MQFFELELKGSKGYVLWKDENPVKVSVQGIHSREVNVSFEMNDYLMNQS